MKTTPCGESPSLSTRRIKATAAFSLAAVSLGAALRALDEHLPAKARSLLENNKRALSKGAEIARDQVARAKIK